MALNGPSAPQPASQPATRAPSPTEARHPSALAVADANWALIVALFAKPRRHRPDARSAGPRLQGLVATACMEIRAADIGAKSRDQQSREDYPGGQRLARPEGMIGWLVGHCLPQGGVKVIAVV